jgi:hypothetical protein
VSSPAGRFQGKDSRLVTAASTSWDLKEESKDSEASGKNLGFLLF